MSAPDVARRMTLCQLCQAALQGLAHAPGFCFLHSFVASVLRQLLEPRANGALSDPT